MLTMPRIKFSMKQTAIALVASLVFLLNTLLPFYASYQIPSGNDAKQMSSLFGDKLLLCTAEGFKLVSWEDLLSGKEQPKNHQKYQCALCYVAAHAQIIKPDRSGFISIPLLTAQTAFVFSPDEKTSSGESFWRKLRTRSPPAEFAA